MEKNSELHGLEFWIQHSLKDGIDPKTIAGTSVFNNLSRILAGTVDSPVNGGVGQYRTFFTAKSTDPEFITDVGFLKTSFNNLIILLNKLLKLHQALIPINLMPQHEVMCELFVKNFRSEIDELKLDVKSKLNLEVMVDDLIKANIHSRRYQRGRRIGGHSTPGTSSVHDFESSYGGSSSFGVGREDDSISISGSIASGSVHSSGSMSRLSSAPGSINGGSIAGRSFTSGKRTVLNYKY
ncbi:unnamed protein product [Ambrosiozyma monospora]|uniref:Unnamed protein product n=1 Tax=Ambrosiozyma monospora TaxID=43982 RepID=A0ACB5U0X7_AMBMO|nr:unnamed protein product [Ambrosiozyma monospora]